MIEILFTTLSTSLCVYEKEVGWQCEGTRGSKFSFFLFFFFDCVQPGIQLGPPAVEAESPNHWIAREFPKGQFSDEIFAVGMQFTLF